VTERKEIQIAHAYPTLHGRGGIERYLLELSKVLPFKQLFVTSVIDDSLKKKFDFQVCKIPLLVSWARVRSLCFAITTLFFKPKQIDVLISQGASYFNPNVVVAHSVHKTWFLKSLRENIQNPIKLLLKLLNPVHITSIFIETVQYRCFIRSKVVAVSNAIKNQLIKEYNVNPSRIEVIYNGVNIEKFNPSRRDESRRIISEKHHLQINHTWFLFVANEFERKGLRQVIQSLARIQNSDTYLIVVGGDRDSNFQELARSHKVLSKCVFVGATTDVELFFNASDVFVFPTRYEPFGLVITEAMASGLTVITTNLAGAAELMTHKVDGFLLDDPSNVEQLTNFMQQSLQSDLRMKIGLAARKVAEQNSWQHVGEKMTKLILEIYNRDSSK